MVVTVTSDVRKDAMVNLGSVLQKGFTLVQMRVAQSSSSSQSSFISCKHPKAFLFQFFFPSFLSKLLPSETRRKKQFPNSKAQT